MCIKSNCPFEIKQSDFFYTGKYGRTKMRGDYPFLWKNNTIPKK